jgi:hypothetical protein
VGDIVTRLRTVIATPHGVDIWTTTALEAADEIERLRALCNDLHHDATCADSFCRLCGEGIREWEAHRG